MSIRNTTGNVNTSEVEKSNTTIVEDIKASRTSQCTIEEENDRNQCNEEKVNEYSSNIKRSVDNTASSPHSSKNMSQKKIHNLLQKTLEINT